MEVYQKEICSSRNRTRDFRPFIHETHFLATSVKYFVVQVPVVEFQSPDLIITRQTQVSIMFDVTAYNSTLIIQISEVSLGNS